MYGDNKVWITHIMCNKTVTGGYSLRDVTQTAVTADFSCRKLPLLDFIPLLYTIIHTGCEK